MTQGPDRDPILPATPLGQPDVPPLHDLTDLSDPLDIAAPSSFDLTAASDSTPHTTEAFPGIMPLSIGDIVDAEAADYVRSRPYQSVDERQLIDRARAFDPIAIGELYERFRGGLVRYMYHRIGDTRIAEDLAEQALIKGLFSIERFRNEGNFGGWLYRIAYNTSTDHYRRESSAGPPLSLDDLIRPEQERPSAHLHQPGFVEPITQRTETEDAAERLIYHRLLQEVVGDLTEEQAQVIELKYIDGLSNKEAAEALGKTEGAIKSLQHRAIASLGRALAVRGIEFHLPVNDRAAAEVDFSFRAALLQRPAHMLNYDLRVDTNPARAQQRRELVEAHILPYIDDGMADISDPKREKTDINTDLLYRKVLYWLLVEEASITAIENRIGEDPNALLDQARIRILDHIQRKTAMEFREIYDLLRGTGWLFTVSRPIRTNLVALSDYRRATRRPDAQVGSTFTIRYDAEKLNSMLGTSNFSQQRRALHGTVPMRVKRGQKLESRDGAHILVHQQRIAATGHVQGDEILQYGAPRVIVPPRTRPLVIGNAHFGAMQERFPAGVAVDDCVISLAHRDATRTMDELPDAVFENVARQRRAEVMALYADLEPVTSYGDIGLPIGHIAARVEGLLMNKKDSSHDPLMREAFLGLSTLHRSLLRLTFITRMPDEEIAKKLNLKRERKPSMGAVHDARVRAYELLYNYMLAIEE